MCEQSDAGALLIALRGPRQAPGRAHAHDLPLNPAKTGICFRPSLSLCVSFCPLDTIAVQAQLRLAPCSTCLHGAVHRWPAPRRHCCSCCAVVGGTMVDVRGKPQPPGMHAPTPLAGTGLQEAPPPSPAKPCVALARPCRAASCRRAQQPAVLTRGSLPCLGCVRTSKCWAGRGIKSLGHSSTATRGESCTHGTCSAQDLLSSSTLRAHRR